MKKAKKENQIENFEKKKKLTKEDIFKKVFVYLIVVLLIVSMTIPTVIGIIQLAKM